MKKLLLLIPCLTILFFACKKKNDPAVEEKPFEPIVTTKGVIKGNASSANIGSAGGELSNADGSVRIVVPAGALQNNTTVTIQPITNTLYNNDDAKPAYRLLPEGTNFSKPVTVIFKYTEDDINGTAEDLMTVAFQQQNGAWKVVPSVLNKQAKTLTIETTHFSDWTKTGGFEMAISEPILKKNQKTLVYLKSISPEDELGVLGIGPEDLKTITKLGNWKLVSGPGTFEPEISSYKGFSFRGEYTAPSNITSRQQAVLRAEVEGFNKIKDPSVPGGVRITGLMILFGRIALVPDGYIIGNVGGVNFNFFGAQVTAHIHANSLQIIGDDGNYRIILMANANTDGVYPMGDIIKPGKGWVIFEKTSGTLQSYSHSYFDCSPAGNLIFSPSSLLVDSVGPVGGYMEGSFEGPLYRTKSDCGPEIHNAKVNFSVQRTQ